MMRCVYVALDAVAVCGDSVFATQLRTSQRFQALDMLCEAILDIDPELRHRIFKALFGQDPSFDLSRLTSSVVLFRRPVKTPQLIMEKILLAPANVRSDLLFLSSDKKPGKFSLSGRLLLLIVWLLLSVTWLSHTLDQHVVLPLRKIHDSLAPKFQPPGARAPAHPPPPAAAGQRIPHSAPPPAIPAPPPASLPPGKLKSFSNPFRR